ncbi:MSHA pilin protein MshA [Vibrio ponticus]|nr:MSHA pilin protein MshA [Vibrio ponticus]
MNKKGFTLIELVVVIVILGILGVLAAPRFLDIQRDAKIATLEATKGALESAFDMFAAEVQVSDGEISKCKASLQGSLDCIIIDGVEVAFNDIDYHPILNPFGNSLKQLLTLANIDVKASDKEDYSYDLNYEDDFDHTSLSSGFWIFPKFDGGYLAIETYKCKIHYMPANHSLNDGRESVFVLETDDC